MFVKKAIKLPLQKKCLLHIDFFGFYNLINVSKNQKSLESFFFRFIEKNYCKKFITPTFNYDFCKKLRARYNSKSQINSLSNYFKNKLGKWRSYDPIFSFSGNYDKKLKFNSKLRSFDNNSSIKDIIDDDGYYFFCGTTINFLTPGIHYLENKLETPYRYDKIFKGTYKIKNKLRKITYTYKVWPLSKKPLNYDAKKINKDLINSKIMKVIDFNYGYYIMYCRARKFNSFLMKKIKKDRLYPLDKKTKVWIKPMLKKFNRPFTIKDFE